MATDPDEIKRLQRRVDELTAELEAVAAEKVRLRAERAELQRARDALSEELDAVRSELEQIQAERPALSFDQLGAQLRAGLAAVEAAGPEDGPTYGVQSASFALKVAVDSDGEQAVIRLPGLGEKIDPGLLARVELDISRVSRPDPDLTGLVLVPTVLGATTDGAETRLAAANLVVGEVSERPAFAPPRSVVEQDPDGGTYVEPGTAIDLVVAAAEVAVPDLVGLTLAQARDRLAALRLVAGDPTQTPSEAMTGTVIAQTPSADEKAPVGSEVDVELAAPPEREVPKLLGLALTDAKKKLKGAELVLGTVSYRVSGEQPDSIIDQRPAAGDRVQRGSTVAVVLARAPVRRAVAVPDVVGQPLGSAIARLRDADFATTVVATQAFRAGSDSSTFATVVRQEPAAGTPSAEPEVQLAVIASGRPTSDVKGIGRHLAAELAAAGVRTVGDLAHAATPRIRDAIGGSLARAAKFQAAAIELNQPPD